MHRFACDPRGVNDGGCDRRSRDPGKRSASLGGADGSKREEQEHAREHIQCNLRGTRHVIMTLSTFHGDKWK